MTLKNYYLLESWKNANNPIGALEELNDLNSFLVELSQTLYEVKIAETGNLEALLAKYIFNVDSLRMLSTGTTFNNTNKILDINSIYVLTRSLIENYLMIFYLYFDNVNEEEKKFRFLLYKLAGLSNRQKYSVFSSKSKEKHEKEAREIETVKNQLIGFSQYSTYRKNIKSKSPNAKIKSWNDLIISSPLNTEHFKTIWSLFSNYAHSEFISVIQTIENYKNEVSLNKTLITSYVALQTTGVLIQQLSDFHISIKMKYNMASAKIKTKVDFWATIAMN